MQRQAALERRAADDGYVLLDSHRVGPEDSRRHSTAALLTGLNIKVDDMLDMERMEFREALREAMRTREEFLDLSEDDLLEIEEMTLREATRRQEEMRSLRELVFRWVGWKAKEMGLKIEPEEMVEVSRTGNSDDIEAFVAARTQMWKEECQAEGRVMGQREYMRTQAAMKFDAQTAAHLGAVLESVTEQEALDGMLAALLECDTPSDLLARATEVRRRANGRNFPANC